MIAGGVATPAAIAGPRAGGSEARATPPAVRQGAGPGRANAPLSEDGSVSTAELVNMLDTYAIVQAQRELTLNDTQYAPVRHPAEAASGNAAAEPAGAQSAVCRICGSCPGPRRRRRSTRNALRERLRALREHDDRAAAETAQGVRQPRRGARRAPAGPIPGLRRDDRAAQARPVVRARERAAARRRKLTLVAPMQALTLRVESVVCVPCVSP